MPAQTLIIPFRVPEEQDKIFQQQWPATVESFSHTPGFLRARLYAWSPEVTTYVENHIFNMKWLETRFRFTTIIEWDANTYDRADRHIDLVKQNISFPSYPAYYRLYGGIGQAVQAERLQEIKTGQEFTFIVPFEVPEGEEEKMREEYRRVVADMARTDGALGPGLYEIDTQAVAGLASETPFHFFNVAEWLSVADYKAAMDSRRRIKPITFTGHGTYYRLAATYTYTDYKD
ncbi:hypothetical protein KDA_70380 [Dictyobacter alpinus]|uniref:ABM domain-containing protein n=1 Tax=Dictyobacter alpinus TaxID=2014873 RepID=A0A402BJN5_9CHLR|nr:hypothetical protein [Dictyobacter alpinus]GCE31554.1 hypothetical protein KDA_70380 [Dictyobacter alpinus]